MELLANTLKACVTPTISAIFSPSVNLPSICIDCDSEIGILVIMFGILVPLRKYLS